MFLLLYFAQKGTPLAEINPPTNHPIIIAMMDVHDDSHLQDQFYVMIEEEVLHDTTDFTQALFLLLAVHYVFNLQYDHQVQEFLQDFVACMKDTSVKHTAFYTLL